jgi:cytohesin
MVKPDTEIVDGEATKITKAPEVPLLIAIQNEDLETVLAHISHGTDLNDTYGDALGTLHTAVLRYNLEVVDALIRAGVNIEMRTKDQLRFTPLIMAAWLGKLQMVELLVESGANLYATNVLGANALQVSMEDNPNIPEDELESFNERRKQIILFLENAGG